MPPAAPSSGRRAHAPALPLAPRPLSEPSADRPIPFTARRALDGFDDDVDDHAAEAELDDDAERDDAEHDDEEDDVDGVARRDPNDLGDDDDDLLDDEFPLGDGVADRVAVVLCPYCGEPSEVAVDPGGGAFQEYVEDCPVCCRPWRVTVAYQADGTADVWARTDDE